MTPPLSLAAIRALKVGDRVRLADDSVSGTVTMAGLARLSVHWDDERRPSRLRIYHRVAALIFMAPRLSGRPPPHQ